MNESNAISDTLSPTAGPGTARAVVLISLVALFAYFNSLHGDFVFDDVAYITDPSIRDPLHCKIRNRPVIAVSLALNHLVDRTNPRGYHALNLAVHAMAAVFLYLLVELTLLLPRFDERFNESAGWIALVCSLVWMVHPLQTQSVTYIIQRCESFMGMFFLASLYFYVRGATAERGRWWYASSAASCVMGTGCKEIMPVLMPLAFLYDRTFLTGSWRRSLRQRRPILIALAIPPAAAIVALFVGGIFTDKQGTVGFGVQMFTPYTYALTETQVILHYLRQTFFPIGLALDYLDWKSCTSLAQAWPTLTPLLVLVAITAVGVWRRSAWAYPAAWFFIILAPSSSIVPVQDAAFEHRMYLPLAGPAALVVCGAGWLLTRGIENRKTTREIDEITASLSPPLSRLTPSLVLGIASGLLILVLGLLTAARNEDYCTATRLYADNVAKRPSNTRARLNLAAILLAAGDSSGADVQLNEAGQPTLQFHNLHSLKIQVLRETGRTAESVQLAKSVLAAKPDSTEDEIELGLSLLADNHPADALPHLLRVSEKTPNNKVLHMNYGVALLATGKAEGASVEFRAARDLDPEYATLLSRTARRSATDPDAKPSNLLMASWYAAAACRMVDSPSPEFLDTAAIALARVGKYPEAVAEAQKAASLARNQGEAYQASRIDARATLFRAKKPYLPEQVDAKP